MSIWSSLRQSFQWLQSLGGQKTLRVMMALVGVVVVFAIATVSTSADESCEYHPEAYVGLEWESLEAELEGTGLIGRIHGAAADSHLYVMSVREPNNFFASEQLSLIPNSEETEAVLAQLDRHDLVCIQGNGRNNPSPQPHITVTSLQTLETYEGLDGYEPYQHEANIPEELGDRGTFFGKVHAIGGEGTVLVVEFKDGVLPIFTREGVADLNLYRGDIVEIAYRKLSRPNQPTHLALDTEVDSPVTVVSAITDWNREEMTLSGALIKFPRSPQITLDVYAIAVETEGVSRPFTLVNFQDFDEFQVILDRLAEIWDENESGAITGRNYLVEPNVIITATGRINVMSPQQANPQILLNSAEDLSVSTTSTTS